MLFKGVFMKHFHEKKKVKTYSWPIILETPKCHYRLPSQLKTPLLYLELVVISCLFCTQTTGRAEGEVRKRPLAAQTDDDSFTAPDWNTTINYGTLHIKVDSIKLARYLIKLPTRHTGEQLNIKGGV